MAGFILRSKAEKDLEDIWRYGYEAWGEEQADSYIRLINDKFHLLAEQPNIGQDCSYIRKGYRKYKIERHVIFYHLVPDGDILIVRILHERMDVESHL